MMKHTWEIVLAILLVVCLGLAGCQAASAGEPLESSVEAMEPVESSAVISVPEEDLNETEKESQTTVEDDATETEYGDIENLNEVTADKGDAGNDTVVTTVQGTESTSVYTLDTLTPNQNSIFEENYNNIKSYVDGGGDAEDAIAMAQEVLGWEIQAGTLPDNAKNLFNEYLNDKGFFEEQDNNNTGSSQDSGNTGNQGSGNTGSQTDNSSNDNGSQQNYTPPVQNETAPQPSYEQQQGSQSGGALRDLSIEEQQKMHDEALKEAGYEPGQGGGIDIRNLL